MIKNLLEKLARSENPTNLKRTRILRLNFLIYFRYAFGLGKRDPYAFGLGKRDPYAFGLGKRDPYAFGLGRKRDPYSFGLGR